MNKSMSLSQEQVLNKFQNAFVGTDLSIQYVDRIPAYEFDDKLEFSPDFEIKKRGRRVAYVEFKDKGSFSSRSILRHFTPQKRGRKMLDNQGVLFVLTDGNSFYFEGDDGKEVIMSFEIFAAFLRTEISLRYKKLRDSAYFRFFARKIVSFSNTHPVLLRWLENLDPEDCFEENGVSVRFSSIEYENHFFLHLLGMVQDGELCRYTTLDSLFLLLKGQKQNMLSLVCMNDKGELSYVDKTVSLPYMPIPDEPNNCFILSLLPDTHHDELTFWRLYGDDASGTCLTYEVNSEINTAQFPGFYLARVSYENNGRHPELELIRDLVNSLSSQGKVFTFRNWHIWKHFFKSEHFNIEDEIRLLFIAERGQKPDFEWVKNASNRIVSKMVLFPLRPRKNAKIRFPLSLSRVLIGPKITEPEVIDQYDYMRKSNLKSVKSVGPSKIENIYR